MVVVDVLDVLVAVAPVVVSVVAKHSTRNVTYQIVKRLNIFSLTVVKHKIYNVLLPLVKHNPTSTLQSH